MNYLNGNIMIVYYAVIFIATIIAMAYINVFIMIFVLLGSSIPIAVSFIFGKKLVSKEKKTSVENETFVDQIKDLLNGFIIIKSFKAKKEVLLTFEKGKSYAVVGSSGSGKSTLLRLLLGFFKNYEGNVYVDNNNLKDISLDSLYDVVSVIQQNVFLFNKSIKDNITMFKEFNINKVERAINISGLSNLISDKGLDYECGEEGANLSGGEKQRISIARCLLRETPILLMDEATAALDNQIAFQVESDILSISGLTRIIVTHKLEETLLDKYDEIVVLKDGQV